MSQQMAHEHQQIRKAYNLAYHSSARASNKSDILAASFVCGTEWNLFSRTRIILPKAMEHVALGVGNLFFKIQV